MQVSLETNMIQLELEKKMKSQNAQFPNLTVTPFQSTSKDWIEVPNHYHAQVDSQPVSKAPKFGYLCYLVSGL